MIELPGAEQTSPRNDDPTEEPASEAIGGDNKCNRSTVVKTSIASIVIGFIIFVIVDSTEEQHVVRTTRAFLSWVEENPVAGVFSFTAVYFLATGELHVTYIDFVLTPVNWFREKGFF